MKAKKLGKPVSHCFSPCTLVQAPHFTNLLIKQMTCNIGMWKTLIA